MRIVFCYWESIIDEKLSLTFENLGHEVLRFHEPFSDFDLDSSYVNKLANFLYDCEPVNAVVSINYIPIISKVCKIFRLPYLSWIVDCPCIPLYSETLPNPHNYVFIFDKLYAARFKSMYPDSNIFYLPSCHDVKLAENAIISDDDLEKYSCDVSFVGSLYSKESVYNSIEDKIPPYIRGYIEGLINAQCNVYGYNFISDSISDDMVREIMSAFGMTKKPGYISCDRDIAADYYIGYKCTERDRKNVLRAVSERFSLDLYTTGSPQDIPNARFRGIADSGTMLPKIFKCSKINLDIIHKSIQTAITVRTYDAMGLGGFVISNWQIEIPDYFTIDRDIVVYESIPDLLNKIDYYLTHDDERMQIAKNGQEKVLANHTYNIRVQEMLRLAGL